MTMQEVLTQLMQRYRMPSGLCLHMSGRAQQLHISCQLGCIDVGLYQSGTGEYAGTLIPLFEILFTYWVPTDIRWSLGFWDDEGAAVDHAWFVQQCADHVVATGWLTNAQVIVPEDLS